jgi:glycosyltransferase involved in cell wall biosynthesis
MACGVPVLVSPGVNLATQIVAAEAGWVVERKPEMWRDALCATLADEVELVRRGARAREFARRFRWPSIADQLHALYDDACATHIAATQRFAALL